MRFHKLEHDLYEWWETERAAGRITGSPSPFANEIRQAVKFYIGKADALPDTPLETADFPRLPYPKCAFELESEYGNAVICSSKEIYKGDDFSNTTTIIHMMKPGGRGWLYGGDFQVLNSRIYFGSLSMPRAPSIAGQFSRQDFLGKDVHWLERWCAFWIGAFLRVINCVNVRVETVPAKYTIREKNLKRGRISPYEYKVLVLRPSAAQRIDGGGTHDSPRIHLRRGHIKHRKTGDFWWQPHVVGDQTRGVVMKDYRADQIVKAHQP